MASSSPLLPTLARRLSFGSSSQASSSVLPSSSASRRRSISTSAPLAERRPDEWSYPSAEGDNRPRRPFLNPDVSEKIPNPVAIRAGLKPYRLPSTSLDVFELPPTLPRKYDILTHQITFTAYDADSLRPYGAMTRHAALALLIPVVGPRDLKPVLQRWAVNKSPFVHSQSKQVFERRTFQTEMDIYDADDKAVEVMVKILLASGRGEHVKVNVQKFSTGSFQLESTSPTTAPLTHSSKRMAALVQQMADRFVKDETERMEVAKAEKKALALKAAEEAAKAKTAANETEDVSSLPQVEIAVEPTPSPPTPSSSSSASGLPPYAGLSVWRKHNRQQASTPHAVARRELDSRPPSKTLEIFINAPTTSTSQPTSSSISSAEHIAELIRPFLHMRSTFYVSSSPLGSSSTSVALPDSLPPPPSVSNLPPYQRVQYKTQVTDPNYIYKSPDQRIVDHTREVSTLYQPLPGTGVHYLAEFPTVEEAQAVRAVLDDHVVADGTVVEVFFQGGETEEIEWSETRGTGDGEAWRRVREVQEEATRLATLAEEVEPESEEPSSVVERVEESAESAKEATESKVEDIKETVVEKAQEAKDTVVGALPSSVEEASSAVASKVEEVKAALPSSASEAKEVASDKIEDVKAALPSSVHEATSTISQKVEDVKEALPSSTAEAKEAVSEKIEDVKASEPVEKASSFLGSVVEKAQEVKEAVAEKVEDVKESVVEKVAEAKESVSDALETANDKAEEAKEEVKEGEKKSDTPPKP